MHLTYVRFDSGDWEAWYENEQLLIEGHVVTALQLARALYDGVYTKVDVVSEAQVDPVTGKAPVYLRDVLR